MLNYVRIKNLGNGNHNIGIEVRQNPTFFEELQGGIKNNFLNNIPVALEEKTIESIWPKLVSIVHIKNCTLKLGNDSFMEVIILRVVANSEKVGVDVKDMLLYIFLVLKN